MLALTCISARSAALEKTVGDDKLAGTFVPSSQIDGMSKGQFDAALRSGLIEQAPVQPGWRSVVMPDGGVWYEDPETRLWYKDRMPIVNQFEPYLYGAKAFRVNGLINDCGKIVRDGAERMGWFDLSTLRERLRLTFGGEAVLRVFAQEPAGVMAELDVPAREAAV